MKSGDVKNDLFGRGEQGGCNRRPTSSFQSRAYEGLQHLFHLRSVRVCVWCVVRDFNILQCVYIRSILVVVNRIHACSKYSTLRSKVVCRSLKSACVKYWERISKYHRPPIYTRHKQGTRHKSVYSMVLPSSLHSSSLQYLRTGTYRDHPIYYSCSSNLIDYYFYVTCETKTYDAYTPVTTISSPPQPRTSITAKQNLHVSIDLFLHLVRCLI